MIKFPLYRRNYCTSVSAFISRDLKWIAVLGIIAMAVVLFRPWPTVPAKAASPEKVIEGVVRDDKGTLSGAVVRIQTTKHSTISGPEGEFVLALPESFNTPVQLTAWAEGYFIGGPFEALPGQKNVTISLHQHSQRDNLEYEWLPSLESDGSGENQGCAECHFRGDDASVSVLPVDEWLEDAHSQSAVNPLR